MTIESTIKVIPNADGVIFPTLSNLQNLEPLKDKIPQDKVKNISFTPDSVSIEVDPVGEVTLRIIDREPNKTLKFTADRSPVPFFLWIQLKGVAECETKMKITLKADLNPMLKMMVSKPLENFVEMLANALASVPYGNVAGETNKIN